MSKKCRLCCSSDMRMVKESTIKEEISYKNFMISNSNYGTIFSLYQCQKCGLLQCLDLENVTEFYRSLVDHDYERGRSERYVQEKLLLKKIFSTIKQTPSENISLLDIGAGSGIMIEAAHDMGLTACGIEPSIWLSQNAQRRNLQVYCGQLPMPEISDRIFSIVTLVDVIEHVEDPIALLKESKKHLGQNSVIAIVTPDCASIAAKVFGLRWWHYRVAHITYFNKSNLKQMLQNVGFELIKILRPTWYFSMYYLVVRLNTYLPSYFQIPLFKWMNNITVPLNLFDSILIIARKDTAEYHSVSAYENDR